MNIKDNIVYISEHNSRVLQFIGPYFDRLIPIGIWLVLVSLLYEIFNQGFVLMNYIEDIGILCALIFFNFVKDRLSNERKMQIILGVVFIMGTFITQRNGFVGNGFYLCIASLVASLVFMEPLFTMILLFLFSVNIIYLSQVKLFSNYDVLMDSSLWTYQLIGLATVSLIAVISISALKRYAIDMFLELDNKVVNLKEANKKLESKNSQIEHFAYIDQMTKLINRKRFTYLVKNKYLNSGPGQLHMLDIANFKQINSFYGMKKGDEILSKTGEFIKETLGEHSISGYFGANSFAVWSPKGAYIPTLQEFEMEINKGLDLSTFLHFYVVEIPTTEHSDIDLLFKSADISINRMKREKKKRYISYTEYDKKEMEEYDDLVHKIENAINEKLFTVYFQEKYNSVREKVIGLEALARLFIDNQFIAPSRFIPIIDDANLSIKFGRLIIEKVFDAYEKAVKQYGTDITISINISPQQLATASFIDELKSLINMYAIDPTKLELEITENILIGDVERAVEIISKLKAIGVKISIDDFGTGYSSLKYLSDLPIDVIKIDKSFIDDLVENSKTKAIVSSILSIAEVSNYTVIAEGAETREQVEALKALGCYYIQGYYYSKPKPL